MITNFWFMFTFVIAFQAKLLNQVTIQRNANTAKKTIIPSILMTINAKNVRAIAIVRAEMKFGRILVTGERKTSQAE